MKDFDDFFKDLNDMTSDFFNADLVDSHNTIDQKALETWGGEDQIFMLIEEMSELVQALSKRKRGLEHNIPEEIADVEIMLSQIKMYLDVGDEVYKWKNFKYQKMNKVLNKKS